MRIVECSMWMLLVSFSMFAQEITIPISDTSSPGAPVVNEGRVTIFEQAYNDKEMVSRSGEWRVKNVSSKPIVALVETLFLRSPSGVTMEPLAEYDAFFHPQLVAPGAAISLSINPPGARVIKRNSSGSTEATCEVVTRWVQFLDGSTFGDSKYAADLLKDRKEIQTALADLNNTYVAEGLDKFIQRLEEPQSGIADAYIGHLRDDYESSGHDSQLTLERLRLHLRVAAERAALMHVTETGSRNP